MTIRNAVPGDIVPRTPEEEADYQRRVQWRNWLDQHAEADVQLVRAMLQALGNAREYQLSIVNEVLRRLQGTPCQYGILPHDRLDLQIDGIWNGGDFLRPTRDASYRPMPYVELRLWRRDCEPMHDADGRLRPMVQQ